MNTNTGQSDARPSAGPLNQRGGSFGPAPKNPFHTEEKEASSPKPVQNAVPAQEGTPDPLDSYRMQDQDMGLTVSEVRDRLLKTNSEPTEDEEEILDQLIFKGFYERTLKLGKRGSFTLRTTSPRVLHNAILALIKEGDSKVTGAQQNALTVAESLSSYNGELTCQARNQDDFESLEAITQRLEFVMGMPLPVVNAIGSRLNAFQNQIQVATRKQTANF